MADLGIEPFPRDQQTPEALRIAEGGDREIEGTLMTRPRLPKPRSCRANGAVYPCGIIVFSYCANGEV
jgi:hypothetical protein